MPETDLYEPIKAYLTRQGYEVKGEVGAADLVARRGEEPLVIVELKTGFSLSLFHQCVERQAVTDIVYMAVPRGRGRRWTRSLQSNVALCKRLGLGVLSVRLADALVEVHLDPAAYRPRQSRQRRERLLREFERRVGDPNVGGATRRSLVTAYRQDALRCAACLARLGPTKGARVAQEASVPKATRIMADDHYGWFERISIGVYALTPKGVEALAAYGEPAPVDGRPR